MEKSLAENSGSFARNDENKSTNDETLHSDSHPAEADPKPEVDSAEAEQPAASSNQAGEDEKKEEVEEVKSPPPRLEKVSEDIDHWLATLRKKDDENNENAEEGGSFEVHCSVERFLNLVEQKIAKYDAGAGKVKWGEVVEEDSWFLETVDRVSKLMKTLSDQHHENSEEKEISQKRNSLVNRTGTIQQRAMSILEEDLRWLLEECRAPTELDPGENIDPKGKQHVAAGSEQQHEESDADLQLGDSVKNFPGYSEETIVSLSKIAGEMLSGGYESECCQVYIMARRNAFEEILIKLGLEKISIDEMIQKVQWEAMARDMIPAWIKTFWQCATVFFPGEKSLVGAVFPAHPGIAAGLFSNLSRGVVIQLLNFAEGAAMTKRAGEKLFKLLDMYEALRDVIPKFQGLFPEESEEELKTEMSLAKSRLGEAVISIFCDLENSIKSETARTPVPGGAVHPLTRYIMNYLIIAGDYKETLEQVFKELSKIERADSTGRSSHHQNGDVSDTEALSPFSAQVKRVMELLDSSLEGKAKLYRDVALSNFFLMNNGRYILQKIKGSPEMSQVMGNTWCRKRSSELRNYHKSYQRETWSRVLTCLSHEGLNVNGKVQKPVLKERFKSFNVLFDEIHRTQSTWVVKDEQLQSELRVSISAVIIPAYRAFVGRFAQHLDAGRQTEKYVKYQPEDIETYIEELFDGKPHQSIGRRKT